jgi:hypothetical protein
MSEPINIRQSFSPGRAYCGCCRTEKAAQDVVDGICWDCLEECYYRSDSKCVLP